MNASNRRAHDERGTSLVEMLIALVILAVGLLAVSRVFPVGSRQQVRDKLVTAGAYYAQEKLEQLVPLNWTDTILSDGRHPAGTAVETLGSTGQWFRYYNVTTMPSPLNSLKKITVSVYWTTQNHDTVNVVTYKRH
jgi:prepilin-type N-terminal cleavage/methylation domain-containing protein